MTARRRIQIPTSNINGEIIKSIKCLTTHVLTKMWILFETFNSDLKNRTGNGS